MSRTWTWLGIAAAAVALSLSGCNCGGPNPIANDAGNNGGNDSGVEQDSGVDVDAGGDNDAGIDVDAGQDDAGWIDVDAGLPPEDAGTTDAGVTPTTLCQDIAKKKCDFWIRCKTDDSDDQGRANDQWETMERAVCEAQEARNCVGVAASWENMRTSLDQSGYSACIDSTYPAATCARDLNTVVTACLNNPYLTPQVAAGGLCTGDFECATGWCAVPTNQVCGTCQAYVATGQACQRNEQCDPATSYCQAGFNGGTCQLYRNTGDNCVGTDDHQCGPGSICARTGTFTRTCQVGKALGAACTGGRNECARTGDFTVGTTTLPESLCSSGNAAGTCISLFAGSGGVCGTGEVVATVGIQQLRGPLCPETEFCAANLCIPKRTANQPCQSNDQCAMGYRCANNLCVAYLDEGATCGQSLECKNPLNCVAAKCTPIRATTGDACSAAVTCVDSYCDTTSNTCVALKTDGQQCSAPGQCESGVCMNNVCTAACWQ